MELYFERYCLKKKFIVDIYFICILCPRRVIFIIPCRRAKLFSKMQVYLFVYVRICINVYNCIVVQSLEGTNICLCVVICMLWNGEWSNTLMLLNVFVLDLIVGFALVEARTWILFEALKYCELAVMVLNCYSVCCCKNFRDTPQFADPE